MNRGSIDDDNKIWDYLIQKGYILNRQDWPDTYRKYAIKMYKNEMIDINNFSQTIRANCSKCLNEDNILCDLAMIAIHYYRSKTLIKLIIFEYVLLPRSRNILSTYFYHYFFCELCI